MQETVSLGSSSHLQNQRLQINRPRPKEAQHSEHSHNSERVTLLIVLSYKHNGFEIQNFSKNANISNIYINMICFTFTFPQPYLFHHRFGEWYLCTFGGCSASISSSRSLFSDAFSEQSVLAKLMKHGLQKETMLRQNQCASERMSAQHRLLQLQDNQKGQLICSKKRPDQTALRQPCALQ